MMLSLFIVFSPKCELRYSECNGMTVQPGLRGFYTAVITTAISMSNNMTMLTDADRYRDTSQLVKTHTGNINGAVELISMSQIN